MVKLNIFSGFKGLIHGISDRSDGNMSPLFDEKSKVTSNRLEFSKKCGFSPDSVILLEQIHSTTVRLVSPQDVSSFQNPVLLGQTDSAITDIKGIALIVLTADCLPILFFDPVKNAIGIAHAGWKGTLGKIYLKTLLSLHSNFGCQIKDIYIGIGPAIGKCCQKTSDPVFYTQFPEWKDFYSVDQNGTGHSDLVGFTINEFISQGVQPEKIELINHCTNHNRRKYFTHKFASNALPEGRFATAICLKK